MNRRAFLAESGRLAVAAAAGPCALRAAASERGMPRSRTGGGENDSVTLCLAGDVMTGRGIDQILPHPSDATLHEPWVKSATGYVRLAERENGSIPAPVGWRYVWGDALDVLDGVRPDARIVNLETSVTTSDAYWPGKGIHYRMSPANVPCLGAAGVDACALANNHVLDWGRPGLRETLEALHAAGIRTAGAGPDVTAARAPAVLPVGPGRRVLVFAVGLASSGIPGDWAATAERAGVWFSSEPDADLVARLAAVVERNRRPGDLVVVSLHWGPNWGYRIPADRRRFGRALVEEVGADAVHGHSSHHPLGIEVIRDRPVLHGCGDLLNDYEGISGRDEYRGDLSLLYLPRFDGASGGMTGLRLVPFRVERFRLHAATAEESEWLRARLDRESAPLGVRVVAAAGALEARWS